MISSFTQFNHDRIGSGDVSCKGARFLAADAVSHVAFACRRQRLRRHSSRHRLTVQAILEKSTHLAGADRQAGINVPESAGKGPDAETDVVIIGSGIGGALLPRVLLQYFYRSDNNLIVHIFDPLNAEFTGACGSQRLWLSALLVDLSEHCKSLEVTGIKSSTSRNKVFDAPAKTLAGVRMLKAWLLAPLPFLVLLDGRGVCQSGCG